MMRRRFAPPAAGNRHGISDAARASAGRAAGGTRPHFGGEQFGFFPGGEVAAPVDLMEVRDGVIGLFGPAARCPPDLARERGEPGGTDTSGSASAGGASGP